MSRVDARFAVAFLQGAHYVRPAHDRPPRGGATATVVVLSGLTGSGKTDLLRLLAAHGEQTLDLEHLAGHRGSAFGNLGGAAQPRHDEFQAMVRRGLADAAPDRTLWVEDEGEYIGSVGLPPELTATLRVAPCVEVTAPRATRVARILRDLGGHPRARWEEAVTRIAPRLGYERTARVRTALRAEDLAGAVGELLDYYDHGYRHRTARLGRRVLATIDTTDL